MRLVIVESPYAPRTPKPASPCEHSAYDDSCEACRIVALRAAELARNAAYAKDALLDCLNRGEAPSASHVLLAMSGVLDDCDPEQRAQGIAAGLAWGRLAEASVAYVDLGWSGGMRLGTDRAVAEGRIVEERSLAKWANDRDRLGIKKYLLAQLGSVVEQARARGAVVSEV